MMLWVLRLAAIAYFAAGSLHLVFGLSAENLLGAGLTPDVLTNPSLDSQNRYYGTSFMIYGALLWLCVKDMPRFGGVFRLILLFTFAGGCSRIIALLLHGWPSPAIIGLALSELLLPPILYVWHCQPRPQA